MNKPALLNLKEKIIFAMKFKYKIPKWILKENTTSKYLLRRMALPKKKNSDSSFNPSMKTTMRFKKHSPKKSGRRFEMR